MTAICLRCDQCGASYDGEKSDGRGVRRWGLHWSHEETLRKEARAIGWTGPLTRESNADRCPQCSPDLAPKPTENGAPS